MPYPRVNCLKAIPFTVAHPYIPHTWQYPPPPRAQYPETEVALARFRDTEQLKLTSIT